LEAYRDQLPLRVLISPGANISRGRNVAIAAATGDVIASVDAGVWLEPQWLACLIAPLERTRGAEEQGSKGAPRAVSGFFVADPRSTFEIAMGATVLPDVEDIDPATFLPSSRSVAYTPDGWRAAGGYPEWLDYCEDLVFDLRLRDAVGSFAWAPGALTHFRPRGSLKAFAKQYYRYARGDGKADLWRQRHAIRYVTYLVALPALLALSLIHSPWWLLALVAGGVAYCRTPLRRLRRHLAALSPWARVQAVLWVSVIRVVGDVAKMLGYPAGWMWRLQNWHRPEIHWRTDG
jgi:glycosyltransferase involved in cell wall biosynthesis